MRKLICDLSKGDSSIFTEEPDLNLEDDLFSFKIPLNSVSMAENLKIRYKTKLAMREIALVAGSLQLTNMICLVIIGIRSMLPFIFRIYDNGNPFHDFEWDSWLY